MLYTFDFMIPANTPINSPVEKQITIEGQALTSIIILIPPGHAALTGLQIYYGDLQLVPANKGEWLKGDDETLTFPETFELPEPTTTLNMLGYNLDTQNNHTFYVRLVTVSESEYVAPSTVAQANTAMATFFQRLLGKKT